MKQKLLYIILLFFTLTWSGEVLAWGETTSYVISPQGTTEIEIENRWSSSNDKTYSWDGPGKTLKFDYRTQWSALGEVEVYATDVNGKETKLKGYGNNSSWSTQQIGR